MTHLYTMETLEKCVPNTFDTEKAEALGLARGGTFTDEYFRLQAFYCEALWNWLSLKADFEKVDAGLESNALRFVARTEYQSVYQQKQSFGTKYLYLRNNIMIENLHRDEVDTLRALYGQGRKQSDAAMKFVEETWRTVITQNTDEPGDALCFLDMGTGRTVANCCLLIGMDTMYELNSEGRIADIAHEKEKAAFLDRLANALSDELSNLFSIPAEVIVHD